MNDIRIALALAAAVMHGTAFFIYARQVKIGSSQPNIATWSITSFLMLLNALTFREMSRDSIATAQLFVGFAGALTIFLYALVRGKFSKPGRTEIYSAAVGFVAVAVWFAFRSAANANTIVLLALLIALWPTWVGVFRNPFVEAPLPWAMWATAYILTTINLSINPDPTWQRVALVNPVVAIFAHGVVAVLSSKGWKQLLLN